MKGELQAKLNKLQELKAKNRVKFKWQDFALSVINDLALPRFVQTEKDKRPLNVRGILMRHAKANLPVFERRFAVVKEHGLRGDEAVLYYLGIVEQENIKGE